MTEPAYRAVCYRCFKPEVTCICARLPRVDNRTPVWVLQHPRERLHPLGTARFARLGLQNARVEVAWNASAAEAAPPAWLPSDVGLLFPSSAARALESLPPAERPARLLVLDGTWHTAKTLYRDKRWLHALPHFRIQPTAPGRYRIRREPQLDYVSTIEAIVAALQILEPDTRGFPELLSAFDAMIDDQIEFAKTRLGTRRVRSTRRPRAQLRVPRALVDGFEQVIVVYGESARPRSGEPREFAYFVAQAPRTGASFECLIHPGSGLPEPAHLGHMRLAASDFERACSNREFCARWAAFVAEAGVGEAPLFAAWNQRTLELLAAATGGKASQLSLKGAYRAVHGCDAVNLGEVVAQHGLSLRPIGVRGRAEERLTGAVAVARFLHAATQPLTAAT